MIFITSRLISWPSGTPMWSGVVKYRNTYSSMAAMFPKTIRLYVKMMSYGLYILFITDCLYKIAVSHILCATILTHRHVHAACSSSVSSCLSMSTHLLHTIIYSLLVVWVVLVLKGARIQNTSWMFKPFFAGGFYYILNVNHLER